MNFKNVSPTPILPVYFYSTRTRTRTRIPSSPAIWLHLIPIHLFLTFFILWLFSTPVNLNGSTAQVHSTKAPLFINETDTFLDMRRLTILAISTYSNPTVSLDLNLTMLPVNDI